MLLLSICFNFNGDTMLVRNLDFLSIPKEFSKFELDIYQGQSIVLVYIENKGYSLVLKENDEINSVFLLKTELTPNNINSDVTGVEKSYGFKQV